VVIIPVVVMRTSCVALYAIKARNARERERECFFDLVFSRRRRRSRMAMSAANIGMMDGAYFVGRNEILSWINATLQLSLSRVEEVSHSPIFPLFFLGLFCFSIGIWCFWFSFF